MKIHLKEGGPPRTLPYPPTAKVEYPGVGSGNAPRNYTIIPHSRSPKVSDYQKEDLEMAMGALERGGVTFDTPLPIEYATSNQIMRMMTAAGHGAVAAYEDSQSIAVYSTDLDKIVINTDYLGKRKDAEWNMPKGWITLHESIHRWDIKHDWLSRKEEFRSAMINHYDEISEYGAQVTGQFAGTENFAEAGAMYLYSGDSNRLLKARAPEVWKYFNENTKWKAP